MREAAGALNVTQPAVSQSLRTLEAHVGASLLDRSTRPASLTDAGHILARATREGLGQISAAVEDIRGMSGVEEQHVTVSCTLGMATYWLMPRLAGFYAQFPDIAINVQAPATDLPLLAPGIDVAIRYGTGGWPEGRTQKLFDERICPVGTPSFVEHLQAGGVGLDLAALIHVRSPHNQHWAGWETYFKIRGIDRQRLSGPRFNNYVQAAQTVLDGRGLALGWRSINGRDVRAGTLMLWPDGEIDLGTAYYITSSDRCSQSTQCFIDWITHLDDLD
jgi:DNA-binding transcriptional LysR family regulator